MKFLIASVRKLATDRRGITAIEYAILAGAISVGLIAIFSNTGIFDNLQTKLETIIASIPAKTP